MLCRLAGFGISDVETFGSDTTLFVSSGTVYCIKCSKFRLSYRIVSGILRIRVATVYVNGYRIYKLETFGKLNITKHVKAFTFYNDSYP